MTLDEIPLTPSQRLEVAGCDDDLVAEWVEAYADPPAGVKNPVGWFLAGVRSGLSPSSVFESHDARARASAVHVAESWIRNVGAIVEEHELLDALYDDQGPLRHWADDAELRARMLERWQARQRIGEAPRSAT